jgi:glycosyltransferase involved in cell wall biosynthesis
LYAKHRIGVVIPAYNEEVLIERTLQSIPSFVDKVYVIDDCSKDATASKILDFKNKDKRVLYIRHEHNKGVGAAIVSGYKQALLDKMHIVAVMAGDNQMDPKFLPHILDPIVWGIADYTKGNRLWTAQMQRGMSRWRSFGNSLLTFLTKVASGYWYIMDPQNGYTAISQRALKTLDLDTIYPNYGYCNDILVKLNVNDFRVVDIVHPARYGEEKSKIKYGRYIFRLSRLLVRSFFWRLNVKYAIRGFHPIYFFYLFGIVLSIAGSVGFLFALWYKYFLHGDFFIRGILSLIIIIIGIQFLGFGMLFDTQQKIRGPHNLYFGEYEDNNLFANGNNNHEISTIDTTRRN